MGHRRVVLLLATVEIFGLLPVASFVAVTTTFISEWGLSNTEAGWVSGVFYISYMVLVPVVMGLTDRIDARRILMLGLLVAALANVGFAHAASGFWSACFWRGLAGMALACIYMPGLRALTDRITGPDNSRSVTFYTASYSIGTSVSFLLAGLATEHWGWSISFDIAGAAPLAGLVMTALWLEPRVPLEKPATRSPLDLRPAFTNREAMGYVIAYGAHCYEMMAFRSWITAFLEFILLQAGGASIGTTVALMATGLTLLGVVSSISGNELAIRFGRKRVLIGLMTLSGAIAFALGFSAALPLWVPLTLAVIYAFVVVADSGSLTSGVVAASRPGEQGATMAVHSMFGFGTSAVGPLALGLALDFGGRDSVLGWGLGFAVAGAGVLVGPLALKLLKGR